MHEVTRRVRAHYEAFPYPDEATGLRPDSFPRVLLGYVERRDRAARIRVLDAGCGTGASLVAAAIASPDVAFTGIDVSTPSLDILRARAAAHGAANVTAVLGDLLSPNLVDLGEPFDVVVASGVLHHVADPGAALRSLADRLAQDGVLALMVYGRFGREPIRRLREAAALAARGAADPPARIARARAVWDAVGAASGHLALPDAGHTVEDAELADRLLHPHELSFTVAELLDLLAAAGLRMLRWIEPAEWDVAQLVPPGPARGLLSALSERDRFSFVERAFDRPALSLLACHESAVDRQAIDRNALATEVVAWNPQARLVTATRWLGAIELVEAARATVRTGEPIELTETEVAVAQALRSPKPGAAVLEAARRAGAVEEAALRALERLLELEIAYRP